MKIPLTPLRFLDRSAKYFPKKTALICGDKKISYSGFLDGVNQAANLFYSVTAHDRKYGKGGGSPPRIVFITWNCHCIIEGCFGAMRAPVIRVPLNVRLTPREWAFMINDVSATAVVVDEEFLDQFNSIKPKLKTVKHCFVHRHETGSKNALPEGYLDYENGLARQPTTWQGSETTYRPETEPVEIFYTSGTTGKPKGVMLSSRNLYINAVEFFMPLQLNPDDVVLHSLALFHINGWGALHCMTACGGTQVVMNRFRAQEFCELVEKHKVTLSCLVPSMMNMLINYPQLNDYDLSSLRIIQSGGAKLPVALGKDALAKLPCDILGSYGLTEASPVVAFATMGDRKGEERGARGEVYYKRKFCAGIETLDCDVKVVDEKGNPVKLNGKEMGEILIRSNVVTDGYWGDPPEAKESFTEGPVPWFRTGDLAVVDPKGYIHIVDRKRDIIIRGGENISSLEIEDVLRSHPSVLEVAVIPMPDKKWGESPLALVVTHPVREQNESELLEHCRENLASFKVPAGIKFVKDLPKSGTGKILKRELRKTYSTKQ